MMSKEKFPGFAKDVETLSEGYPHLEEDFDISQKQKVERVQIPIFFLAKTRVRCPVGNCFKGNRGKVYKDFTELSEHIIMTHMKKEMLSYISFRISARNVARFIAENVVKPKSAM